MLEEAQHLLPFWVLLPSTLWQQLYLLTAKSDFLQERNENVFPNFCYSSCRVGPMDKNLVQHIGFSARFTILVCFVVLLHLVKERGWLR